MAEPTLPECVDLLERLAAQQLDLNDQLLTLTRRLGEEHALYQERLAWHDEMLTRMQQTLDAIKDMLDRGNGRS